MDFAPSLHEARYGTGVAGASGVELVAPGPGSGPTGGALGPRRPARPVSAGMLGQHQVTSARAVFHPTSYSERTRGAAGSTTTDGGRCAARRPVGAPRAPAGEAA